MGNRPLSFPASFGCDGLFVYDQESKTLQDAYDDMQAAFLKNGLVADKVTPVLHFYVGMGENETPRPLNYDEREEKLPESAVRLLVIPLEEFGNLKAALEELTMQIIGILPPGTKVNMTGISCLHILA